jgi:hypothetical protein
MASPAFIYAFDSLGPDRFVALCGLLLGGKYRGFLLSGPGPDGGIDGELTPAFGELLTESPTLLLDQKLDRPVRAFSKWFVRNGAKPSIHPRREAQKLQNTLL